jgi:hypothetical protein
MLRASGTLKINVWNREVKEESTLRRSSLRAVPYDATRATLNPRSR